MSVATKPEAARPSRRAAARPALHLRDVHKSLAAGNASCSARVRVLCGASLDVATGELVVIAGDPGSGKSVLLLCAAGLMRPDAGSVLWNGGAREATRRLYCRAEDLATIARRSRGAAARLCLVLVDEADGMCGGPALTAIATLRERGAAVVIGARDPIPFAPAEARVFALHDGRLAVAPAAPAAHRVAHVAERRALR